MKATVSGVVNVTRSYLQLECDAHHTRDAHMEKMSSMSDEH